MAAAAERLPGRPGELPWSQPRSWAPPAALDEWDDQHLPREVRVALRRGKLRRELFWYALRSDRQDGPGDLGSGANRADTLPISADADFEVLQFTSDTRSNLDLELATGGAGGRSILTKGRLAFSAVTGTGLQPYWLPTPIFVRRSTLIVVTVTETGSGSRPYNLFAIGSRFVPW